MLIICTLIYIGVFCFSLEQVLVEKMGFPEGSNKASSLADGDVLRMYSKLNLFFMFSAVLWRC